MAKPSHVPSSCHNIRFPSQAVLSALALIAATPSVLAATSPPPDFLCPFIHRDIALATPQPQCSGVADRYIKGPDSLWHKTDAWTLFGSTCCSTSSASPPPSQPTTLPSPDKFDTSVLPAGWVNTSTVYSGTGSNIILALAIILAGSICGFMIGCVFWRRHKKKTRDIERKPRHRRNPHLDSQSDDRGKDAQGKMRMWAKATARWKSSLRQSVRRRQKRHLSSPLNRPSSPFSVDSPQSSVAAPSQLPRRSSIALEEPDPFSPEAAFSPSGNATEPPAIPHDLPCASLPPTYGASFDPRFHPAGSPVPRPSSIPPPVGSCLIPRSNQSSPIDAEQLPYIPPRDGHVATDDKSQLACIRALASSPPITVDAPSTVEPVSAPEWHEVEDDLEDKNIEPSKVISSHNFGFLPPFPPPPSMADIPFGYLDGHPLRCREEDDISPSLPICVSSGPSFGLPSVPSLDDSGLEPSAPSLEGDDELFQDWDEASSYAPDVLTSPDLDSVPTRAAASSISSSKSSVSRASLPSIPESAVRDGILPRYHP